MSFDALATHYRWMEAVLAGQKLQRCRTAFLDRLAPVENILIAGEGHGKFLVPCRRRFPRARITCVDSSVGMILQARRNLRRHRLTEDGITFVLADALTWQFPTSAHDLIVTHFFLDCFNDKQLERVCLNLGNAAKPDAHWLLADFQQGGAGLGATRNRLILSAMYAFFRVSTHLSAHMLLSPDRFLEGIGFRLCHRIETEWGLLRSDCWQRGRPRLGKRHENLLQVVDRRNGIQPEAES